MPVVSAIPATPAGPLVPPPTNAQQQQQQQQQQALEPTPPAAELTPPADTTEKHAPEWIDRIALGGGAILYQYQPINIPQKPNFELFFAYLLIDGKLDNFGLHFEPRFRDTRLRPFFDGPMWVEEAYAWMEVGPVTFKAGKIYSRLGLFWDNSFYGNVQLFDGLKLDPDQGVSAEGSLGEDRGIGFTAQYFVVDGRTNLSLEGRDTISIPFARRRNMLVARIDPFTKVRELGYARLGLSLEHFTADLPDGERTVNRLALDGSLTIKRARLWGEWLAQYGQTVTDLPYPRTPATATTPATLGRSSFRNTYWLLGGEYTYGRLTARYDFSRARYATVAVAERTHVIGLGVTLHSNLVFLAELVSWSRTAPDGERETDQVLDRSLNLTLTGRL
jgi:hypothetical protein